ncbi:hypothetical protein Bbelb_281350 [Branchiostoma belcheri]|nr:hypothetical protein Bbelb_281350 [Branchiostoma belcheri]
MASWSRALVHYSTDFLRGLKRAAATSDPHLKNHLLSLGVWKLRTRARGKKAGRLFRRDIPTVVGNRPLPLKRRPSMFEPEHTPLHTCKSEAFLHRDNVFTSRPTRILSHIPFNPSTKSTVKLPSFLLANVRSLRYKPMDFTLSAENSRAGGGVALYLLSELQHKRLSGLEEDGHEALWLWLRPARLPRGLNCLVVAAIYNPPKSSATHKPDDEVTNYLGRCLEKIEREYSHPGIVILGDTNKYKSQSLCARYGLKQVVSRATRGNSQLDSIFTNLQGLYSAPVHLPPIGTSDHETILLSSGSWPSNPPLGDVVLRTQCDVWGC